MTQHANIIFFSHTVFDVAWVVWLCRIFFVSISSPVANILEKKIYTRIHTITYIHYTHAHAQFKCNIVLIFFTTSV